MGFRIGDTVGDYRIVGSVGSGGAGEVFRVEHRITGRVEAMKVLLHGRGSKSEAPAERFQREIKLQASLNHPNIASVHNAFWAGDELVMVMELVEGESLDRTILRGPMPMGAVLRCATQALQALDYAHGRGITHRDIKPENIMVTPDGVTKLMDFGLAKERAENRLTQTGTVVGSLYYISPEQARGLPSVDHRTDIYSFGATLYEMVTGVKPFPYGGSFELLQAAVREDPRPPSALAPDLPPAMEAAILRAMSKNPDDRFPSAREFRRTLEAIARNPGIEAAVVAPRSRTVRRDLALRQQSRRQIAMRAALVLLSFLGLGYLGVRSLSRTPLAEAVRGYQEEAERSAAIAPAEPAAPTSYRRAAVLRTEGRPALLVFSGDGRRLAALSETGWLVVANGSRAEPAEPLGAAVASASWDRAGSRLATAGPGSAVNLWDMQRKAPPRRFGFGAEIRAVALAEDGARLACSTADGALRVWTADGAESWNFAGPPGGARALAFSPAGPLLATSEPGGVRLWALGATGAAERLNGPAGEASSLAFSENGLELAAAAGASVAVWDMPGRALKWKTDFAGPVLALAHAGARGWLAVAPDSRGVATIWSAEARNPLAALVPGARAAALSPDGRRAAVGTGAGEIVLWDATKP